MAAATKPRPYRRILTSALHRRFVHASALELLVCYAVSFLIGDKSSFLWSWFPIGACGVRAMLLFLSSLVVFILRVGQMHLGARTTLSPISTLKYLVPINILQTFGWYFFSAWLFSEIYKWSSPIDSHLEWVNRARPNERASLNERPIYIYTCHFLLAAAQSVVHLWNDFDRIPMPVAKRESGTTDSKGVAGEPVWKQIQAALPQVIRDGVIRSAVVAAACPVAYLLLFRRAAWSFTLYFAKLFWDFPRSAAEPPGNIGPVGPILIVHTIFSGALLTVCWQTANLFFSLFLSQEPLKRGQPLTADAKDPNGSLLTGLTAKKETVQAFAFWELYFISRQFPDKRKAIFNDIDREGGSAWSQILLVASDIVKGISTRIDEKKNPPGSAKPGQQGQKEIEQADFVLQTLPRLTDPIKTDNVFVESPKPTSRPKKFEEAVSSTAKSYGSSPDWTPKARARARGVVDQASSAVLTPESKRNFVMSSRGYKFLAGETPFTIKPENVHPTVARFLRSPVGRLFAQTYDRRLSSIVLGTPHANICSTVYAIESVANLLVASLQEDKYGKVQADVPAVVKLYTDTIMVLEPFIHGGLDAHWTDVTFPPSSNPEAQAEARRIPDVEIVLHNLKASLRDLLTAFKPYLKGIGVVGKDLRLAKEAAGIVEEDGGDVI